MSRFVVECRDVVVGYDEPVLEGVGLAIEHGEIVALLGASGCGKSTLLRALTGLLPPLGGEVRLFGRRLYELPGEKRRRLLHRTGTVFQSDALFGAMTVAENVALPLHEVTRVPPPVIDEMVAMRLALVGIADHARAYPAELSGGQRKRAALARASILDPDILFCDEPTTGLDPPVAAAIDETLLRFRAVFGMTIVVVTHELDSIRAIADRAVMLGRGTILAEGRIDELSENSDEEVFNFFHRVAEPIVGPHVRGAR